MSIRTISAIFLALTGINPASAQKAALIVPRPTLIDPDVVAIAFAEQPHLSEVVGRDQPFLEGILTYGYGGKLTTDLRQGKSVVVPAGSPAYAIPLRSSAGVAELVWCAFPTPVKPGAVNVCITNSTLGGESNDSLMVTGLINQAFTNPFSGGVIALEKFSLGAPIRVAYYVQNLGKITRLKAEIFVGDIRFNKWIEQWGDIARPKSADEKLISVAGGVIGIKPDPTAKGRFMVRAVSPLQAGGSAILQEIRNDVRR
jgi:hypothetical protein